MKLGRDFRLLILALVLGCQGAPSRDGRLPESLGALPEDLPLPPRFTLDPGEGESSITTVRGKRSCTLFLKGPFSSGEIREFFLDHMRLARWKPQALSSDGKKLTMSKGEDKVVVTIGKGDGKGCRVRVSLNPKDGLENSHE